ncbi:MAG: hypothetical protein PUA47_07660 [Bacteroidales bacterium]|nr:hypothetical protein [Bacteroidales bacterium]
MEKYKSKTGTVSKPPYELYMSFVDMTNFTKMLPEDKKSMVEADYDTITVNFQGLCIGAKVQQRIPYSYIGLVDWGNSPVPFHVGLNFGSTGDPYKTAFSIEMEAEFNFMMKMMIGKKLQEGLDKLVDGLVAMSEGRMPEGVDPEMLKNMKV